MLLLLLQMTRWLMGSDGAKGGNKEISIIHDLQYKLFVEALERLRAAKDGNEFQLEAANDVEPGRYSPHAARLPSGKVQILHRLMASRRAQGRWPLSQTPCESSSKGDATCQSYADVACAAQRGGAVCSATARFGSTRIIKNGRGPPPPIK
jgi:hypothetical protein